MYVLDLFEGIGKKGHCDLACGTPVDDWGSLFRYFNSLGSWSYSKEWV